MSKQTLPLLFLNLSGEMLYIFDQRLRAQEVPEDKAKKALHELLTNILDENLTAELFKFQDMYTVKAMRTFFEKISKCNAMKMNANSVSKLYDLMSMAVKYQMSLCNHPMEVVLCTLNHLDNIREFADGSDDLLFKVEQLYHSLQEMYGGLSPGEYQIIRQTILRFFQDSHINVSMFVNNGQQKENGRFVLPKGGELPWGTDPPGTITLYDEEGNEQETKSFDAWGHYQLPYKQGVFEIYGERMTTLGLNMYVDSDTKKVRFRRGAVEGFKSPFVPGVPYQPYLAIADLDLLYHLVNGEGHRRNIENFRLRLFEDNEGNMEEENEEREKTKSKDKGREIEVEPEEPERELEILFEEFTMDPGKGSDDLLELMDSFVSDE